MLIRPDKEKDTTLTPLSMVNALGKFDLDPCAFPDHRTASYLNIWPNDGLSFPWFGRVWCNPPYSNPRPWMKKLADHGNGVALVLASTDTEWFQEAAATCHSMLFMKGRPRFHKVDGSLVTLMRATVLIEWGGSSLASSGINGHLSFGGWLNGK